MILYKNINIHSKFKNSVLAIGNFDGLHVGHRKVLQQARNKAKKNKLKLGVLTFEPIPVMFFNKNIKNHRINTLNQKINFLKKQNIDFLVLKQFNKKFSNLNYLTFIKNIIFSKLKCRYLYVSKNFRFGKNREGNVKKLKLLERKFNYKTLITKPYKNNKKMISSSMIRKLISKGKIKKVNYLLGRAWCVSGKVVKGKQRGRKIGFPTCNIKFKESVIPKFGVYSVKVKNKEFMKRGIANVGYRPTFKGKNLLLEVNIFGINKNLYNKVLNISFNKFIRPEKKFKDINELKKQIKKDIKIAKK